MLNDKLALIFPGQGSQSKGMLAELAEKYSIVLDTFNEASEALSYDLWDLVQNDEDGKLNQTQITQPALLCSSVALFRIYKASGLGLPAVMAGHSLGEYSALVCSGVISFTDGIKLVEQRGLFMQAAVEEGSGSMAAILGLEDEQVIEACKKAEDGQVVSAVNFNAPGQVVIAGDAGAVERAIENCKSAGARKAMPLAVSVPSHCSLMGPAAEQLSEVLGAIEFSSPEISVVNNVDVKVESDPQAIREALIRQLTQPVRWVETIKHIHSLGVENCGECGPGKVLAGLGKRIEKGMPTFQMDTPAAIDSYNE